MSALNSFEQIRSKILNHLSSSSGTFCQDSYGLETNFSEFQNLVECFAANLKKDYKKIAILAEKNYLNYAAIIAVVLSGRTWIPISSELPEERIADLLTSSKPDLILTSSSLNIHKSSKLTNLIENVLFLENFPKKQSQGPIKWADISDKETAIIYHTSGSTGIPKGVEISFLNLATALNNISPIFAKPNMLWGDYHDLSFVISINILFKCLVNQGKIFCANNKIDQFLPAKSLIEKGVNCLVTVPSTLNRIEKDKNFSKIFSNLKVLISCGEPLPLKLLKAFVGHEGVEIFNFYGSTEVSTWVFYHKCSENDLLTFSSYGYAPLGEVIPNNRYMISDEGLLLISGDQICKAYTGKPKMYHLQHINGSDWFSTGDIVEILADKIICKGRVDNQIKLNGYRIHLMDIETKAMDLEIIDGCICFLETFLSKSIISCTVVTKSNISKKNLMEHFNSLLPTYMVPKRYYVISSKPTNKNGKLDRVALKTMSNSSNLLN